MRITLPRWAIVLTTLSACVVMQAQYTPRESKVGQHNREPVSFHNRVLMNQALVHEAPTVTILLAAKPGRTEDVVRHVEKLRGKVVYRDDNIDYLRVELPTAQLEGLISLTEVAAYQLDTGLGGWTQSLETKDFAEIQTDIHKRQQKRIGSASVLPTASTKSIENSTLPAAKVRGENPYISTRDLGAAQFIEKHPTFDGRGVTIASIEGVGVAFAHPTFQPAKTLEGKVTRKIVGILNPCDLSDLDPSRVRMDTLFTARENRFLPEVGSFVTYAGSIMTLPYTLPHAGTYRLGLFAHPAGLHYPVLWEESSDTVWVDTNRDRSFADERPLADVNKQLDIGQLRTEEGQLGDTDHFVVSPDKSKRTVHIYLGTSVHATMVASVAAGNRADGNLAYGMAPEAQLMLVYSGTALHNYIEAFILAARHPAVDLITSSSGGARTLPNMSDALVPILLDRISDAYKKLIFRPGSNGAGAIECVNSDAGRKFLTVGGYISRETFSALFGVEVASQDWVVPFSSRGPTLDGNLKPDIIVPAHHVSADVCSEYDTNHPVEIGKFHLPPCYQISGGTSAATPVAAGIAALLVSAAKQSGVAYDVDHLRWALRTSARFLPGWSPHEQGAGLLQVDSAWKLLKKSPNLPEFVTKGTVSHIFSPYLRTPGIGMGIYEREGWMAGQSGVRNIELVRRTGASGALTFRLTWQGNDGTFQSPTTVELPLGERVSLPIQIQPHSSGAHSAILNLIDPATSLTVHQIMTTVVAAEQFSPRNSFSVSYESEIALMGSNSHFVNVPEGAAALRLDLRVSSGKLSIKCGMPLGPVFTGSLTGYLSHLYPHTNDVYRGVGTWSLTLPYPKPGVWALSIENGNTTKAASEQRTSRIPAKYQLTATVLGVGGLHSQLDSFSKPVLGTQHVDLVNRLGALQGAELRGQRGTAFRTASAFAGRTGSRLFEIQVERGTSTLLVQANATGASREDLELYLYDCSSGYCFMYEFDTPAAAEQSMIVRDPAPGKWKVIVSPGPTSTGRGGFEYLDVMTGPAYGRVTTQSPPTTKKVGEKWRQSFTIGPSTAPAGRREPVVLMEVIDEGAENEVKQQSLGRPLKAGNVLKTRPISLWTQVYYLSDRSWHPHTHNSESN